MNLNISTENHNSCCFLYKHKNWWFRILLPAGYVPRMVLILLCTHLHFNSFIKQARTKTFRNLEEATMGRLLFPYNLEYYQDKFSKSIWFSSHQIKSQNHAIFTQMAKLHNIGISKHIHSIHKHYKGKLMHFMKIHHTSV